MLYSVLWVFSKAPKAPRSVAPTVLSHRAIDDTYTIP